jgi:hypothetical protein
VPGKEIDFVGAANPALFPGASARFAVPITRTGNYPSTEIGPDKSEEEADFTTFLYGNLSAMAIRRQPVNHPGHLDLGGHRLIITAWE